MELSVEGALLLRDATAVLVLSKKAEFSSSKRVIRAMHSV